MKKHIFLLAIGLLGVGFATAQDVTILHMKDGTQRRYTNGLKNTTEVRFYEFDAEKQNAYLSGGTTNHENGFDQAWDVTQAWHENGQYAVAVVWVDDLPQNFQARHGLCLSSEPNVTVDHCDSLKYYSAPGHLTIHSWGGVNMAADHTHYIIVGKGFEKRWITSDNNEKGFELDVVYGYSKGNRVDAVLQPGSTYYYRTFAEVQVEESGQTKTICLYGPEKSFRVPKVMGDAGYFPYPQGTDAAVTAFAAHFPDSVTAPTWKDMEMLWDMWRATPEGAAIDLKPSITTQEFEDGTGYRLNYIPDEFYDWMTKREVVIDAFDGLAEVSKSEDSNIHEIVQNVRVDSVDNVAASWNVAGGKYIRFTPKMSTVNVSATYRSYEVVPGLRYKLQLNFAPETVAEKTESTEMDFLPTKVTVTDVKAQKAITDKHEVPVTEASTLVVDDFCTTAAGLNLKFETNVTSVELRRHLFNRIMRIAEIQLIPVRGDE